MNHGATAMLLAAAGLMHGTRIPRNPRIVISCPKCGGTCKHLSTRDDVRNFRCQTCGREVEIKKGAV